MADNENRASDKPVKKEKSLKKLQVRMARWTREMRSELKKVVWPTSKQVFNNTVVVIVMCIVTGIVLGVFDWLTGAGVKALIQAVK